jgi:hypothetical protein
MPDGPPTAPQPPRPGSSTARGSARVRDRLKRDPFFFLLCLGTLAFLTWALALAWWVTGGPVPLALALVSILPALLLFYLRDA